MYTIYEFVTCVFAAFAGSMLLFTACILFVALKKGFRLLARSRRERARQVALLKTSSMVAESGVS